MTPSATMTHDEFEALLVAVALDVATDDETHAVLRHVATCAACGAELARLRRESAQLLLATPAVPSTIADADELARMRERVLARARADVRPLAETATAAEPRTAADVRPMANVPDVRRRSLTAVHAAAPWAAALAATLAIAVVGIGRERAERRELAAALAAGEQAAGARAAQTAELRASLAQRDSLLDAVVGAQVTTFQLSGTRSAEPRAAMYWNRATNAWTFVARALPALAPGRTYQVWLVTRGGPVSVGVAQPDARGEVTLRAEAALDRADLRGVAVTEEAAGGVPAPTGAVVLEAVAEPD